MLDAVTTVGLGLSVASFIAFLVFAWRLRTPAPPINVAGLGAGTTPPLKDTLEAIAKLVEAIAKLADSLAKAGPAIASLIASLIFFGFAFAGAIK